MVPTPRCGIVHGGVYRESVEIAASGAPGKPIRFLAAPGARVVVTGADRLTEWRREPGEPAVYSTPWPHRFIDWEAGNAHGGPPPIGRAEQVFVDGYLQHQVLERRLLSPGSFWVDLEGKRLHLCPADNLVSREPARIERLVVMNTIPVPESKRHPKIVVLSVAQLLADIINRIYHGESISSKLILS